MLEHLASDSQTIAVIVVTAQGTIDNAVQAMRMGAYDYVTKPIDTNRLRTVLQNAGTLLGTRVELEVTRRKLAGYWLSWDHDRALQENAGDLSPDRDGCAEHGLGTDHGSERNGQGTGGAHGS